MDPCRPCRAAGGPYGTTIAHGYLTLALAGTFVPQLLEVRTASAVINYGADRLRFLSPVRTGSSVSARAVVAEVAGIDGGVQVALDITIDIDSSPKPACAVRSLLRYLD